jgi:hypothetical protein
MARVFRSESLDQDVARCSRDEQERVETFAASLKRELRQGKRLGPRLFEKKLGGKRLLFLRYDEHDAAMLVAICDKKMQQRVIDEVNRQLPSYDAAIRALLR